MDLHKPGSSKVNLRIVLYQGETMRLPERIQGIRNRDGVAWVSYAGDDIFLSSGEEALLPAAKDFALVSAVGARPLVLEILGERKRLPPDRMGYSTHPIEKEAK